MTTENSHDSSLLKFGQPIDVQSNTLIDWSYLHELSDGNEAFELELLQTLVESLPPRLKALRHAVETQDFVALEHEAHYIKGSTTSIGATELQAVAEQLELQARHQQPEGMVVLLEQLETGFKQVENIIQLKQHP